MVETEQLIQQISAENIDVKKFSQLINVNLAVREEIIRLILTHPHIMVYYHCYYILDAASLERPDLFYSHWDDFADLLEHKNSYHRDIGMTILANLTQVDEQDRFAKLFDRYFSHLHDAKFLTAINCVQNGQKIMGFNPRYIEKVLPLLLSTDSLTHYPVKQKELMKAYILSILDERYASLGKAKGVTDYIISCINSCSPKTKAAARKMVKKYGLANHIPNPEG